MLFLFPNQNHDIMPLKHKYKKKKEKTIREENFEDQYDILPRE